MQREPVEDVLAAFPLQVDHNWVESSGTRATLVFVHPDPKVAWGYVDAPIVIETERPRDYQVRLEFDLKGDHRRAWPAEWPAIEPAGSFRLPTYAWRRDLDRKVYQISRVVRIYFRKPSEESPRLELSIRVVDPVSGTQLSPEKLFLWESISTKSIGVSLEWLGTTNPSYVTEHPIGPQLNVESLLNRLNRGSSVAVIAPRRFGKSTLVEYLHRELLKSGCAVPQAQVCTLLMGPGSLDLSSLWTSVSDGLQELLDVGLPRSATTGPLPPVRAFDAVRRAAKSKRYKAVVLLFDEAQLLFSGMFGKQIGTQLKDAFERDWSRTDQKEMVPLCVALIGLPSLRDRAGVDLMGLLMPIERSEMKEDELRPLVGAMTKNLQTTKAARVKLCESAGNLFILRVLLERLTERVQREGRCWCNYDDVKSVQEDLEEELRTGRDVTLSPYIRDALNDAELVTDWEPSPSFPVAAALAPACHVGQPFDEAVLAATAQLNDWGRLSQGDERQIVTPTYESRTRPQARCRLGRT